MGDGEQVLAEVAAMLADLAAGCSAEPGHPVPESAPPDPTEVLEHLVRVARRWVPGVAAASVGDHDGPRFRTRCASDDRARGADALQFELTAGPAVEALVGGAPAHVTDALADPGARARFGQRLAAHGFLSALCVPLCDAAHAGPVSLNLYSEPAGAFDPAAIWTARLLAAHGGLVYAQAMAAERVANLERALVSTQTIGPAIGLIMAQHRLGHDQAMELLRKISQRINRKVSDLAVEVVKTGALRQ